MYINNIAYGVNGYEYDVSNSSAEAVVTPTGVLNVSVGPTTIDNGTLTQFWDTLIHGYAVVPRNTVLYAPSFNDFRVSANILSLRYKSVDVLPVAGVPRLFRVSPCSTFPGGYVISYNNTIPHLGYGDRVCGTTALDLEAYPTSTAIASVIARNQSILTFAGTHPGVLQKHWFGTQAAPRVYCPDTIFYVTPNGDCYPITACVPDYQYETVAPTWHSNRVCTSLTSCGTTSYQSIPPTATTDRVCTPITECTPDEYVVIGHTPTSDRGCAPRTTACNHGYYYTHQSDAPEGTTQYLSACTSCPPDTTTWVGEAAWFSTHTLTECTSVYLIQSPCIDDVTYFSVRKHSMNPMVNTTLACRQCRVCGAHLLETSPCTPTTDTVCSMISTGITDTQDPPPTKCNSGYYLNTFNDIDQCVPCTVCETQLQACGEQDTVCGEDPIASYLMQFILVLYGAIVLSMIAWFIVLPLVEWKQG